MATMMQYLKLVQVAIFFQLGHFGTQDVSTVVELALIASVNVGLEALVLGFEVDEFQGIFRFQSLCQ
ncbi:hypothetical protein [Limnohabitans sp. Rim8]|uniref:hypothetical protein n=1 Tax=Limnohabitans sp. Rim8 TaxID=1100718 RepID=UPI0026288600|nr:hypothetical protein [Limnohabitans sp. Rim8]